MKKVLTIAGSDSSGGAGIQADLKTFAAHKVYGMSAITALTAQNTTGVFGISEVSPDFLKQQIDAVFTDIFPDAVKIGMVSSVPLIDVIAERLDYYQMKNVVLDPVMVSTSGAKLISGEAADRMISKLMPLARVITPNIPEAEKLAGFSIRSEKDVEAAGEEIYNRVAEGNGQAAILIKGGHRVNTANDYLYMPGNARWYRGEHVDNPNTHGTGCTLSSAIAANLALGYSLEQSVDDAKKYLTGALLAGLNLGAGSGPLDHLYNLQLGSLG